MAARLALKTEPVPFEGVGSRFPHGGGALVRIFVDGRDLRAIAADCERPYALAEGQPHLAGTYLPLHVRSFPRALLYGSPEAHEAGYGDRVALLRCNCGEVGCWPLLARISVTAGWVAWSDFQQPFRRGWRYDALGQLRFAREHYDAVVREAERDFGARVRNPPGWLAGVRRVEYRNAWGSVRRLERALSGAPLAAADLVRVRRELDAARMELRRLEPPPPDWDPVETR